jgi:hypothetical protein
LILKHKKTILLRNLSKSEQGNGAPLSEFAYFSAQNFESGKPALVQFQIQLLSLLGYTFALFKRNRLNSISCEGIISKFVIFEDFKTKFNNILITIIRLLRRHHHLTRQYLRGSDFERLNYFSQYFCQKQTNKQTNEKSEIETQCYKTKLH